MKQDRPSEGWLFGVLKSESKMGIEGPFFEDIEVNHNNIVETATIERYIPATLWA